MSAYQGYPQGQGPGGYDEGRARAPGNPPDGRYSKIETDPLVTSMAQSVPMSRVMPGTVETFKRPGQYSEEDFTGVPDAKRSCCKTGGLPVKGQGQAADWRCGMIDAADRPRTFFVFNLMLKTTAYDLFKYFVKFGDLKKFHVFNNDEGKNRHCAVCPKEAAIAALAAQPHFIHKKKIIISHDRDPKKISTVIKSLEKHKLYVPNIPLHVSEEDLCEYFSQWGNILSCYVTEHAKRTSTKYGFISYTNYEDAVKCLNATHNYGQSVINVFVASNCKALRDAAKDSRNNAETNKLFVNYIPHEATADELKQHFSMWGKSPFAALKEKIRTNSCYSNSRYGFVCYQELEDALKAMIMPHTLKHKKIFVSVAEKTNTQLLEASKDPKIMSAVGQKVQNCYLSVSNVNVNTTKEELYEYFKKYGSLASCAVKPAGLDEQIALLAYVKEVDAACCFRDDHFLNQRKLCLRWTDLTGWVPHKAEPPSRKLRISGLAAHTHSYTLMCYFSRLGRVEEFELVKDATLRPTGCAFVIFEKLGDAEKAVSNKPHVIDDKEIKVTYARHHENLPSETFPSWREQRPQETVQQQRLPESIKSLNQGYDPPEAREPRRLLEDAQPRRLVEDAQPRRLLEDAQPQRLLKDAQPQRLLEHTQPRRFVKDAQPQRLPEVYQPRRQSTQDPLMSRLTQVDSIPDMPLVAEYECNVSGCLFKGKSEQFDHHWTKIHEAKVLYLICSFCSMECVDADDFREHLDFFHGIEDRSEMSTFLLGARQEERDNIHFVMPGSVTRETCMKVTKPPQKKDAEDHLSGFHYLRCPKCPKSFMKKDFLLLHIKNKHQNTEMRTEEEPEAVEDNSEGSENLHFGSSPLERAYDEFQRQILPRSETDIPTISDIGSRSAGNRPMQTMPTSSLSAPLLSSQNVQRPQLPILPSQQPTPRSDPQLLASQVPTQQAVPFHGQVTPFYPSTASVPKPVPPPPRPPPVPLPPHQLYVGSQSYSYPRPPVSLFSNTSTRQPVVASRPAVSTQSFIVPPVSYSQVPFQPQVRAQSQQASVVASPHTQVVASVAPSVVPPTSPRAGAPLQLPQTGQVITQSVSVQPPEFVMEQPPVASQSVVMSSEDPSSIPERDAQDLKDFDMGNMTTQETSPESESEPEMVTEKKANDELRRSVQSGSVLALSPEWTKTLKIAHPKKSSLEENTSEKKCSFKTQVKFVPKFDRTHPDSIQRFLLWSHIMMERLEDANIKVRRRLKADEGEGDVAVGDDDEDPGETGGGKSTAVKGTLSQAHKDMKARAQTVAKKVVAAYRSTNRYTKRTAVSVASNKGQSKKGVGKQRQPHRKALASLFHKSAYMIKSQSMRANVDADLVHQGISWVKRDIRRMLEQNKMMKCETEEEIKKASFSAKSDDRSQSFQQRTDKGERLKKGRRDNSDQSRKERQQRTDNCGRASEDLSQRRNNSDRSRKEHQQRTDNRGQASEDLSQRRGNGDRSRKERQQRTDNRGRASEDLSQRRGNGDRSRKERQQRTDNRGWASEDLSQRRGNGDRSRKEHQQRTDNPDRSRYKHQHRTESRGQSSEDLQQLTDTHGWLIEEIPGRRDWNVEKEEHVDVYMDEYVNESEEYALAYVDEDGVHVMDDGFVMGEGGNAEIEERMDEETEEEYLEYRDDDRTSFSSARNSSVRMRRDEDGRQQSFEDQMYRVPVFVEDDGYFDEGNEFFVEEEIEGFIHSERVVEVVKYDDEHEGAFNIAWSESAHQDGRILPGAGSSLGREGRRLDRYRGFPNQHDSFKRDNSVTRGSQGRRSRAYSKSSSAHKSVRRRGEKRNRGREIPKHTEHVRKDDSMKRDQKEFVDDGTTKSQKMHSKKIDDRDYQRNLRNRSLRDKASRSKTKSQYLKKEGVDTKNKDQMSSNNKKKRKSEKTEGNIFERKQDDISDGVPSGDDSICELDMDDVDMGDFFVMDEV